MFRLQSVGMTGDSLSMDRFAGVSITFVIANKHKCLEQKKCVWDTFLRSPCSGTYEYKHSCYEGLWAM